MKNGIGLQGAVTTCDKSVSHFGIVTLTLVILQATKTSFGLQGETCGEKLTF